MKIIVSVLLVLVIGCAEKKSESKEQLAALALFSQMAQPSQSTSTSNVTTCTSTFNCATVPSFSTLTTAGTTTNCALSGCHTTAFQQSGLDITDYNSVKTFTNPGNPCSSRIYIAITTGPMVGNSNAKIKEAVYCWIAGGSNK
jgi:hypothetical protein